MPISCVPFAFSGMSMAVLPLSQLLYSSKYFISAELAAAAATAAVVAAEVGAAPAVSVVIEAAAIRVEIGTLVAAAKL